MKNWDKFLKENWSILGPLVKKIDPLGGEKDHKLSTPKKLRATLQFSPSKINPVLYAKHHAEKNGLDVDSEVAKAEAALEKIKSYGKKVSCAPDRIKLTSKKKPEGILMKYDDARLIFWKNYLSNCIPKSKNNPKGFFVVDENNRYEISQLLKYIIQDPTCDYDLKKGICIHGPVGSGKTNLLRQISNFAKDQNFHNSFPIVSMKKVNIEVSRDLSALNKYSFSNFCFDEVVSKTVNCFGTKVNPVDEIIQAQYDRFLLGDDKKIHITSNIDLNPLDSLEKEALQELFDIRSLDRLRQMCNYVYLGGPSRRD